MIDADLVSGRLRAKHLCRAYNNAPYPPIDSADAVGPERRQILADLFNLPYDEVQRLDLYLEPPIFIDYGVNMEFRGQFYCNYNCTFLDCAKVIWGVATMHHLEAQWGSHKD